MMKAVVVLALIALAYAQLCPDFSYSGSTGPEFWGSLCDEYATCDSGNTQSPIDIRTDGTFESDFDIIQNYHDEDHLEFHNNGHTVEVSYGLNSNNFVEVRITDYILPSYELLQFHFHTPSENTLNGNHYDMECHFVHSNEDGELLVIGVWFEGGSNDCDFLSQLEDHIPEDKDDEQEVDISTLIDLDNVDYYSFSGSLTTPPCTEGVSWYLRAEPIRCSNSQINAFSDVLGITNRPVQPKNNRSVTQNFEVEDDDSSSSNNDDDDNSSSSSASMVYPVVVVSIFCVLLSMF